jgi:predicted enzyme related to lactoylglutathione lyase
MRYPNGFPGWIDLASPDMDAAAAFYSALFGWEVVDSSPTPDMRYAMLTLDGRLVAGLGPQMQPGVPPTWTVYVMVGDVDEIVAATPDAGGQVLVPPMDVMTLGRMAVVSDPSGAVIGLWQPQDHQGADVFNVAGTFSWCDLQSRDIAAALPFYEELFGWRWEQSSVDESPYLVAHLDAKAEGKGEAAEGVDTSVAGAMTMPPGVPDEVPSMWGVYFTVADLDATLAQAGELGGTVVVEPVDIGEMGRFAMLADPAGGAGFYVIEMPA